MTELSALLKVLEFEYFAGRECLLGEAVFLKDTADSGWFLN